MNGDVSIPSFAGPDTRRLDVIRLDRGGLDYIDVRGDGRTLIVAFFGRLPKQLNREHFVIDGGRRITSIEITSLRIVSDEPDAERVVALRLARAGDDSTYTLRVVGLPDVDPLYAALPFTFNRGANCRTDCDERGSWPPVAVAPPPIDYLSNDYATFRRMLLDRAAYRMPEHDGGNTSDLSVSLIELLAHVGDQLSIFQDAVAGEAYLATARKRVSVRRQARLIDYGMHDGGNARAWISLSATADTGPIDSRELLFSTTATPSTPAEFFEPVGTGTLHVYAAQSRMHLYAWGNCTCTLAAGATAATLRDAWESADDDAEPQRALRHLEAGMHVLLEALHEVDGGRVIPADPAQRHVVRLTNVRRSVDPLYGIPIVEIAWARADRLPFRLAITACDPADSSAVPLELSVVRGNLVRVDHGRSLAEPEALPPVSLESHASYRPVLARQNLTFAESPLDGPAASFDVRDPRCARAQISELMTTDCAARRRFWSPVSDLLASGPNDMHYVAEVDENGMTTLRFGDGVLGRRPPPGATAHARYRVGNAVAGNVGADTIVNVAFTGEPAARPELRARNPLPARGGTAPESADDVRALAPSAARAPTACAITAEDYARFAQRDPRVRRAAAQFCWTGSRTIVRIALDPLVSEDLDPDLVAGVGAALEAVRRIGHELEVVAATYVPLRLALNLSVKRGYAPGQVRKALEEALSSTIQRDGRPGFFHPDALSFGGCIAQSAIVARSLAIDGVENVTVARFERLYGAAPSMAPTMLRLRPLEIGRLDGDPARPGRGVLAIDLR